MATITGLTAERMLGIEGASIVDGEIIGGNLILTTRDGTQINAGPVSGPPGPPGPTGPAAISSIPGEVKLWPGSALPDPVKYGKWVWADGSVYLVATYPLAAANIATQWRTFSGASDPGASNFRVPDIRGLVPAGLDAMPGGSRANRMTRTVAITLAARTGEETHVVTVTEMPSHGHTITDPGHTHFWYTYQNQGSGGPKGDDGGNPGGATWPVERNTTGITINNNGGGSAHENVQPTVFVPYIVRLDG